MQNKQKGEKAELKAMSFFVENGYKVYLPWGVNPDVDLVAENQDGLIRIQVKYAGSYGVNGKCVAALRVMGGNQSFHTAKKYSDDAFDYLFIYTAKDEQYLIPWRELVNRSSVNIEAPKYLSYKIVMQG